MPSDVASPPVEPGHASAVWRGATIELTLWGSGSCPAVPVALVVRDPTTVEITVSADYGQRPCTADMVPTTSVLDLPDAVGGGVVLTVWLRGLGSTPVTLVVPRQPTQ